jgi:hypothetical protein
MRVLQHLITLSREPMFTNCVEGLGGESCSVDTQRVEKVAVRGMDGT